MTDSPEPSKKRQHLGWLGVVLFAFVLINLAVTHYADKKQAVLDIWALLFPAPAQQPMPIPKQADAPKQAEPAASKQPAARRAEGPPPPKKKQPQSEQITTGSICVTVDYIARDLENKSEPERHFQYFYMTKDFCTDEPLPITILTTARAKFVDDERFRFFWERRRPTIIVELAPGQDLTGISQFDPVHIEGKLAEYKRKDSGPPELIIKDGRIKRPRDPNNITATR